MGHPKELKRRLDMMDKDELRKQQNWISIDKKTYDMIWEIAENKGRQEVIDFLEKELNKPKDLWVLFDINKLLDKLKQKFGVADEQER